MLMRHIPTDVQRCLAYPPPGSWMPSLPEGCIRLSAGYPAPSMVPVDTILSSVNSLLTSEGDAPLHYLGSPSAYSLPHYVHQRLMQRGIPVEVEEILITAGACQALDLVAHAMLDTNSLVAVEAPTYMEALEVFRNYTPHIIGYGVDGQGLNMEVLEADLHERRISGATLPKLLYTIPSFQNPTGTSLSLERRTKLLQLADEYDFYILEDDAYGELAFETPPVTLKSMDKRGRVIHVGSFSKVIAPGLRIGWIAASKQWIGVFDLFKKDLGHPLSEGIVSKFLSEVLLEEHIHSLRRFYRSQRDAMLSALQRFMPTGVTWTTPEGGYFVWLRVADVHTGDLLSRALESGVAYVPGQFFYHPMRPDSNELRLSFSYLSPDEMHSGVEILAETLKQFG